VGSRQSNGRFDVPRTRHASHDGFVVQKPTPEPDNGSPAAAPPNSPKRSRKSRSLTAIGAITVGVLLIAFAGIGWKIWDGNRAIERNQALLEPFYTPPADIPAKPGTIIRSEPMDDVEVPGGKGYRLLYTSTGFTGEPAAVSGMIFIPTAPAPAEGRKVVAWAHPTTGLADKCAPSRSSHELHDLDVWLDQAMSYGWVVTATDYLGLGTPGPNTYLIGTQEAADVVNSVRAARNFPDSNAGSDWIVWGHSQGGHSALWTGTLADKIAPELKLRGVGAAAPASELTSIVSEQWRTPVGWAIGPDALVSFQDYYGTTKFSDSLSGLGKSDLADLLGECVLDAGVEGLLASKLDGTFFGTNPIQNPAWAQAAVAQTPAPLPASMPVFLSQGTADTIVLSGSNALMQETWCKAGSDMTVQWLGDIDHQHVAMASGSSFIEWANNVFDAKPPKRNCDVPPASPPIAAVVPPENLLVPSVINAPSLGSDAGKPAV